MKCNSCKKTVPSVSTICPFCGRNVNDPEEVVEFGDVEELDYSNKLDIKAYVKEPKNKKVVLLGVSVIVVTILVFAILIMSLFGGKKENPYKLFTDTTSIFFDFLEENFTGSKSQSAGTYELELKVNDKEMSFQGEYGLDTRNKIINLTGVMSDPRENTGGIILDSKEFDFNAYLKENNFYFSSPQIMNNLLMLFPLDDAYGFLTTKNYDLSVLISGIEDATIASLKEMDYIKENANITYLGKNINVNKRYFVLDNAGKKKFLKTFYDTLMEDSNFLNEVSRLQKTTSDEVRKVIENYSTTAEYKYSGTSSTKTNIAAYYEGMRLYRIELESNEDKNKKLVLDIGETKYYLDYFVDNKNIISSTLALVVKDKTDYIIKNYEVTFDTDKAIIDFTLKIEDSKHPSIKKIDTTNHRNIRDFKGEDYESLKRDLNIFMKDVTWVDSLDELFKDKCSPLLNCVCEEGEDVCSCMYENKFITCPRKSIEKMTTTTPIN